MKCNQVACLMSSRAFPSYFSDLLSYGRRQRESDPAAAAVVARLETLTLGGGDHDHEESDVTQLYNSEELRAEHATACGEITQWMRRKRRNGDSGHTDPVLNILLCMVMLFNPDVDFLEDPSAVERVRDTFVKMATRYVDSEYDDDDGGSETFGEGMRRIVSVIGKFNELHDKRLERCVD